MSSADTEIGSPVRPLKWWPDTALAEVETVFLKLVTAWRQAWVDDVTDSPAVGEVKVWRAHEFAVDTQTSSEWSRLSGLPEDTDAWIQGPGKMADTFFALFPGASEIAVAARHKSVLMADIADLAWMELLERIMDVLSPGNRVAEASYQTVDAAIPGHHGRPWSGALRVTLSLTREIHIALHLGPGCASSLCSPSTGMLATPVVATAPEPLIAVEQAIDLHNTRLSVELAPVEISLGSLQALAIGDVLVLPHALKQALDVRNEHDVTLCQAYLGQHGGMRAVELVARVKQDVVSEI
ncbi:FliM/FliN family flagellar motor switch protein [Herbaspirillum autotrophicum]|uniref:FliM/FliN family flagellar motor switch protein n=1 Tax=Herbaspirillum autotrophicum TaxID=180195 RepID=UPI00067BB03C|nr:FliM/FliN family flagellar motor C-terminal domain-containing protein [Herbaspirillum autotrophicum]